MQGTASRAMTLTKVCYENISNDLGVDSLGDFGPAYKDPQRILENGSISTSQAHSSMMDTAWMTETLAMPSHVARLQRYLDVKGRQPGQQLSRIDPIFVAVDVETDSRTHQKLLEVGVSVLDTRDLQWRSFDNNALAWCSQIKSYHYLMEEHKHIKLTHPPGCPDNFDFGKTSLIKLHSVPFFLNLHCKQTDPETGDLAQVVLVGHAMGTKKLLVKTG